MPAPLDSLKILDFSTLLPGPFATLMLADLGADVIRVEAPHRPDPVRFLTPRDGGESVQHGMLNRSKRSLALNLKAPGAVAVVQRLVATYDIVIEQFRPGVMDRLGVGYAALRAVNPALIYCSLTGYGQNGPLAPRAGHDLNYLALAGVMSHAGRAGQTPAPLPVQAADLGGGAQNLVIGLLAAVIRRHATGEGAHVDIAMFDGALAWNGLAAAETLHGGAAPAPEGTRLNGGIFYDCYATADGRYLTVGALEPGFWRGVCDALGRPDLFAPGLSPDPADQATVKAALRAIFAARPLAAWRALFAALDVCVEPVLTTAEALDLPHVAARGMMVDVPRPDGAAQAQLGSPIKMSGFEPVYRHTGRALGADSADILAEAGFSAADVEQLVAAGAVTVDPTHPPVENTA